VDSKAGVVSGDRWGHVTRLIAGLVVEDPKHLAAVQVAHLAPGPARELVALVARRHAAGLPADAAAVRGLPEVERLGVGLVPDLIDAGPLPASLPRYLDEVRRLAFQAALDGYRRNGPAEPEDVAELAAGFERVARPLAGDPGREERDPGRQAAGPVLKFLSADEALALAPERPAWVWEDYIGEGLVTMIAGPPKRQGGKSTFVWALVEALLTGARSFVGRFIRPGPVVYLTEEPLALLRPKLLGLAGVEGLSLVCRDNAPRPKPSWASSIRQAVARCRQTGARVLVIDTLAEWALFRPDAEKDAGAMVEVTAALAEAAAKGIAIVLIHHHRKGGGEDGEGVRGSSALTGAVNVIVDLTRLPGQNPPPRQRILNASSHWPGTPESLIVEFAEDATGYRLVSVGERETARTKAREVEVERLDERIVAAVKGGATTQKEAAAKLGVTRQRVQPRFDALVKARTLVEVEKAAGRRPARYAVRLLQPPLAEGLQQTRFEGEAEASVVVAAAAAVGSSHGSNKNDAAAPAATPRCPTCGKRPERTYPGEPICHCADEDRWQRMADDDPEEAP